MLEPVIHDKASWTRVAFGDVVHLSKQKAKNPEVEGYDRVVGLEHIEPGDLRIRRWADIADGTTFNSVFKPGQVLFGKRRAYQRKVAVADFEGVCSGDIYVMEPSSDQLLPELLPFICQTDAFFDHAVGTSAGSLSPRTNWNSLADFEFLLPPIQEQARLVKVCLSIEENLNSLYAARMAAQELLRAILFKEIPLAAKFNLGERKARRFGDYVEIIDPNPSHRYPKYSEDGYPLVATQDFDGPDGFNYSGAKRVPEETFLEQKRRCRFEPKDVVFARKGILGLSRFYGEEDKAFSHTIVMMKPKNQGISSDFLLWLTRSDSFMAEISRGMNANSGVPTLGVESLANSLVAVPDREKQDDLVAKFNGLNAAIKNIEIRKDKITSLKALIISGIAN